MKLTKDDVVLIKTMLSSKQDHEREADVLYNKYLKQKEIIRSLTHQSIADKFDVSKASIQKIKEGDNWNGVEVCA